MKERSGIRSKAGRNTQSYYKCTCHYMFETSRMTTVCGGDKLSVRFPQIMLLTAVTMDFSTNCLPLAAFIKLVMSVVA